MTKNRIFIFIAAIIMAALLFYAVPGCQKVEGYADAITENILVAMNESDFEKFSKDFDDNLKMEVSASTFPTFLAQVNGRVGPYIKGSKEVISVQNIENRTVINYSLDFEKMNEVNLEINLQKIENRVKVVGLWFK